MKDDHVADLLALLDSDADECRWGAAEAIKAVREAVRNANDAFDADERVRRWINLEQRLVAALKVLGVTNGKLT